MFKVWHRPGVFIVNFKHISHLVLVFLLVTLNKELPAGKLPRRIGVYDYKIKQLLKRLVNGIYTKFVTKYT